MVNKPGKPKSKRQPVRLRHKITKAGHAKARKQKKLAKKNPEWRTRLKKDPGIPNLFPYKDQILHDLEEKRRLKDEEREKRRGQNSSQNEEENGNHDIIATDEIGVNDTMSDSLDDEVEDGDGDSSNPMAALLASARARAQDHDDNDSSEDSEDGMELDGRAGGPHTNNSEHTNATMARDFDPSSKNFQKIFKQVIQDSDIILYVLDARDPNGTRSHDVENEVLASSGGSKRLILILNKIDLIPPSTLQAWLKVLRRSYPTLPLRASTPASNANTFEHKALTLKGTAETLVRALKSYSQSERPKQTTTVGIIGYPNVGKSSVINALTSRLGSSKHAKSPCPVGAEAGVTTATRLIKLDNKLKMMDSPGIVFPGSSKTSDVPPHLTRKQAEQAHLVLLAALPPFAIDDPLPPITLLLHRLSRSSATLSPLMDHYSILQSNLIPQDGDLTTDFLVQVARKRGRMGRGGVPNLNAAAMTVLTDWRDGRIRGWVEPPSETGQASGGLDAAHDQKEIVQKWSKEFKIEGLWGDERPDAADGTEMEQ